MKALTRLAAISMVPIVVLSIFRLTPATAYILSVSGVVQHLVLPGDRSRTFFSVVIERGFSGDLPGAIDAIRVQGPEGTCPVAKEDFHYLPANREFWATLPGTPLEGRYAITVTAGALQATVVKTLTHIRKLPIPRSPTVIANKSGLITTNRPTFTWQTHRKDGRLFYQLQLKTASGQSIYRSPFIENATAIRPEANVLDPGALYYWRIRVLDRPDWMTAQNRAQTGWAPVKTAAVLGYGYIPPTMTDDGWTIESIEAFRIKRAPLERMLASIINHKEVNIHGVLLIKNGKLVLEEYFEGHDRDDLHLVASVTKSVNSLLFGQAMDMGFIKDLEQPAWNFFPEYDNPADIEVKRKITLRHLLTMTAGLEWDYLAVPLEDPDYITRQMIASGDPMGFVLGRKVVALPGRVYNYNDGVAMMLGEIIHRATARPVDAFAETGLFAPLGIKDYIWEKTANGIVETHGGLFLRLRDMGKIGQLVLQRGRWHDRQVVSEAWLRESTREHVRGDGAGYGYQWRNATVVRGGRPYEIIWASGYGGQRIFIVPDLKLVAVITSKVLHNPGGNFRAEQLFVSYILPALVPQDDPVPQAAYRPAHPETFVGYYRDDHGVAAGHIVLEKDRLFLVVDTKRGQERCELSFISETELIGRSLQLGEFRIVWKGTEQTEPHQAVVKIGLKRFRLKKVE